MEEDWELISAVSAPRPFGRQLERGSGAGAGFVKEERDPAMGQAQGASRRIFRFEQIGQAQDGGDIFHLQRGDGKQGPRTSMVAGAAALGSAVPDFL